MPKFLPVQPHRQKPSMCGPACLKMVFHYYGVHATEEQVGKIAKASLAFGTDEKGLRRAAEHYGFSLKIKDDASFADIRRALNKGIPPIVDWFSEYDGHYSVVVGLDPKKIHLQDPELGHVRSMDRRRFYRCWFDFPKDFIRKPGDLYLRRLIIVQPKRMRHSSKGVFR